MSYKSALQSNNIDLSKILVSINELPEGSSSGGSVEISLQEKTIAPSKSQQIVTADSSYDGLSKVTVDAIPSQYITTTDANATESDIASGKTAYVNGVKVTGSHVCSGGETTDTSDATAIAEDILSGKTAYINGGKITGALIVQNYYVGDTEPDNSIGSDNDLYFVRG
jgi:hypothetical protein